MRAEPKAAQGALCREAATGDWLESIIFERASEDLDDGGTVLEEPMVAAETDAAPAEVPLEDPNSRLVIVGQILCILVPLAV